MTGPAFSRQAGRVDLWAKVDSNLHVAQLCRGGDAVDSDIGRPECRPHVVGVMPETLRGLISFGKEASRCRAVFGASCRHRSGEEKRPVDRQVLGAGLTQTRTQVVRGVAD